MPIVRRTLKGLDRTKIDWTRIDRTSDADIRRQIAADPDTAAEITDFRGFRRVRPPTRVDVKALRRRLGLSQAAFASRFGFSLASVRNWEQGHRRPEGPARVLLRLILREPAFVLRTLRR
jgi:putative transcriptional regulator